MKFIDILRVMCEGTRIVVVIPAYDIKFKSEHSKEYFEGETSADLLQKEISSVSVIDGTLTVNLA